MKETTRKLLERVDEEHDWREGKTYSGGGTKLYRTDVCRVCGLQREYVDDRQNGVHGEYTFIDADNHEVPLREVVAKKCLPE